MNEFIRENPNFICRNGNNLNGIKQILETTRNLREINKSFDNNFISLNQAIVENTNEEIKLKNKNVIQQNEICELKANVSVQNDILFELKEQLNLRKLSE